MDESTMTIKFGEAIDVKNENGMSARIREHLKSYVHGSMNWDYADGDCPAPGTPPEDIYITTPYDVIQWLVGWASEDEDETPQSILATIEFICGMDLERNELVTTLQSIVIQDNIVWDTIAFVGGEDSYIEGDLPEPIVGEWGVRPDEDGPVWHDDDEDAEVLNFQAE